MLPVLTRQPPGKRTKPGCRAAIFSARSLRRPWPLYVSRGMSEIMSSATGASAATVRRPVVLSRVAVNLARYLAQPPRAVTCRASASAPSASCRVTVSGVLASARAQTEKSYVLPLSTLIPVL